MSYKTIPEGNNKSLQYNDSGKIAGIPESSYSPSTNSYGALEFVTTNNNALDAVTIIGDTTDVGTIFSVRALSDPSNDIRFAVGNQGGGMNGVWILSGGGQFKIFTGAAGDQQMLIVRNVNAGGGNWGITTGYADGSLGLYDNNASLERFRIDSNGTVTIHHTVEYADNAAALTAGLTAGNIYRTGDFLKIVH